MKKITFSIAEKRLIRFTFVFVIIQVLIVFTFLRMFSIGQPVNIHNTNQVDIIVDEIYPISTRKEQWLVIIADSKKYLFESHSVFDEYSLEELNKSISKGDKLKLKYYEEYNIWGKVNLVVDARNETEVYRSIEEYNNGKQGVPAFVAITFTIIELIFVGIVFIYGWLNYNTIKGVYKKIHK